MDSAWLTRMRWRRRGAWMWPSFVVLTVVDAYVVHARPYAGDSEGLMPALLFAGFSNFIAVVVIAHPVGALVRRVRRDLPRFVARDYAGTWLLIAVAAALLAAGLVNHSAVVSDSAAMRDAEARAIAWIGYRAPPAFRGHLQRATTFTIQAGTLYRTCVPSSGGGRTYCVIVDDRQPANRSVRFAGYEPNTAFAVGLE
ncbi:MAG TPA: hypothetical protein VG295_04520 [Solirubrobacteraceae bacterium]|nr:hypothetical protein [Solirubrobacteraceae bacterium]